MAAIAPEDGGEPYRAFICDTLNPFGYPAKDRSGRLSLLEEPHLGKLMTKVRQPAERVLSWDVPPPAA
jgi:hypothetical protein